MEPDAGRARELEHARDRLVLCDRRARAGVRERVGAAARGLLGRDPGADDLVVLGVDSGQTAGRSDRLERAQQLTVGDPREPLRVGLKGRELERRRARVDQRLRRRSIGPRGGTVAHSATSTCASRSTSAILASNASMLSIGPAAS